MSHQISPPFKKLDVTFDDSLLLAELEQMDSLGWIDHVNERVYRGKWDVFPLRCDAQHIDAHPVLQGFAIEMVEQWQNLPLLNQCPTMLSVLTTLQSHQCEIHSMRLMRLCTGAEIAEHRDHGVGYDSNAVRLHIPIITNPQVEFIVAGSKVTMRPGEMWYINADLPHAVANRGDTDRIHLVIDGVLNDWLAEQITTKQ